MITADGPGSTSTSCPARRKPASGGSRGRRSPACRRRRSARPSRRARSAATSWRARSASFRSWLETKRGRRDLEPLVEPPGATRVLAGDEVGLLERPAGARAQVLEVADRRRADGQASGHGAPPRSASRRRQLGSPRRSLASPSRAIAAAPIIPASGPSAASVDLGLVHRRQRTARAARDARAPAAARPPRPPRRR